MPSPLGSMRSTAVLNSMCSYKPNCAGVGPQILPGLLVAGVLRIVVRHREVGVLGQPFRRDQMRRTIDAAGRLAVVPVAADVVFALEQSNGMPACRKFLATARPDDSGADDAIFAQSGPSRIHSLVFR